mmetsp:Transcript_9021/g.6357  ORF Transcript_9021/g.6357 Transcript_9021/m.6357 type:complete len:197 (+) Transcript_9021:297-887(+)
MICSSPDENAASLTTSRRTTSRKCSLQLLSHLVHFYPNFGIFGQLSTTTTATLSPFLFFFSEPFLFYLLQDLHTSLAFQDLSSLFPSFPSRAGSEQQASRAEVKQAATGATSSAVLYRSMTTLLLLPRSRSLSFRLSTFLCDHPSLLFFLPLYLSSCLLLSSSIFGSPLRHCRGPDHHLGPLRVGVRATDVGSPTP